MNEVTSITSLTDILSASGHIAYQWDLKADRIVWCGPWQQLFGHDREQPPINALELSTIVLPNDHHLIFNDTTPTFNREYRLRAADNSFIWVQEHGTTDFEKGRAIRQQGMLRIIEDAEKQSPYAVTSPDRDPLTGRPNRACMLSLIEKILKISRENRHQSAYLVVGIDKLAFVNEAMGTKAADHLICAVADRLNELCPTRAIVGRVAGDMFGVLLPNMAHDMESLVTRILANFHDHALSAGGTCLHLSVCVGTIPFEGTQSDATEMMIHAEQALSEAREKGRGQNVTYSESARRAEQNRIVLDICERVKQSLKNDTVKLAFQPVVDAKTGEILFYEVLSRLFYDDGTAIPAGEFIPIVEQMGMAPEFDEHVLDLSLRELAACDTLHLAVNISGLTAALPHWPDHIKNKLSAHPDLARRLIIEITETAAVMDIAKMKNLVEALRSLGSEVSLDDFGAGSTSIRHLRDLDFAIMKIDRDLIIDLTTNGEQQHLVRMLIAMAHGLGLRSVAEGIEDEEVAQWLRDENVDMLQGYHLGRPSFEKPWLSALDQRKATSSRPLPDEQTSVLS
jgi:diguanylate cyclase (GGDEF)-like protein